MQKLFNISFQDVNCKMKIYSDGLKKGGCQFIIAKYFALDTAALNVILFPTNRSLQIVKYDL